VFFTCEDHEHLLPLEQAINARWGDRVNVSFSTLTCLEVMAGGVSKGMRWKRWRKCSAIA
jgi:hydroxymethylpyrimidine pyrophosphatase-like HAD family hydrolase